MARRTVLTSRQRSALFALPQREADLLRYYTLSDEDLQNIGARRRPRNKLGFALQLCVLRYLGRLLAPSEFVPPAVVDSSDASSTWPGTSSPTTRSGPRPGTIILPNYAACTDSGPSRAARRVSSETGSAKKRSRRSRTRTWSAGSSRPAVAREPSCRLRFRLVLQKAAGLQEPSAGVGGEVFQTVWFWRFRESLSTVPARR